MTASRAILIAGLLIAGAIVLTNRYEIVGGSGDAAWRLDRLTGEVVVCIASLGCKTPGPGRF